MMEPLLAMFRRVKVEVDVNAWPLFVVADQDEGVTAGADGG